MRDSTHEEMLPWQYSLFPHNRDNRYRFQNPNVWNDRNPYGPIQRSRRCAWGLRMRVLPRPVQSWAVWAILAGVCAVPSVRGADEPAPNRLETIPVPADGPIESIEDRLDRLERENDELRQRLDSWGNPDFTEGDPRLRPIADSKAKSETVATRPKSRSTPTASR